MVVSFDSFDFVLDFANCVCSDEGDSEFQSGWDYGDGAGVDVCVIELNEI